MKQIHKLTTGVALSALLFSGIAIPASALEVEEGSITTFQGSEIPAEVFENAVAPIDNTNDPSQFEFPENVGLTQEEAGDQLLEIGASYELGQALSPEDLEIVRAYAAPSDITVSAEESVASTEQGTVSTASYASAAKAAVVPAAIDPWTGNGSKAFSKKKTAQKVSAKLSGRLYVNTKSNGLGNTWRIKSFGKITAGRSNVKKNSVSATFYGYGAVAAWPYVGLIYNKTASASNGKSNVVMDKSYSYNGLLAYWSAAPKQSVRTKSGSYSVTL